MPSEPDGSSVLCILFSLVLLILSAFYAAAESALDALSPAQLKKDAEAGDKKSKRLLRVLEARTGIVFPVQYGLLFAGLLGIAFWLSLIHI